MSRWHKKGFERKKHKYVARVDGRKPGTYRYFYSTAAYEAYQRAKGAAKEGLSLWKSGVSDLRQKASDFVSSQSGKLIPKPYTSDKIRWTEYNTKTNIESYRTMVEYGIEWLNTRFPIFSKYTRSFSF